jgi:formylglycine-generating enzyme required for sulfatase activity
MGCSPDLPKCYPGLQPAHSVTITKGFWIGQTPVTQAAYKRVTGRNPSHFQGDQRPVEMVSWDDAVAYCGSAGMRLPAEEEWEYAARAGTTASQYGDLDHIAWYALNSGRQTHDVGQKQPNAWGLYDMLGNVFEWTLVVIHTSYKAERDRVYRGCSWGHGGMNATVTNRELAYHTSRFETMGFRCAGDNLP